MEVSESSTHSARFVSMSVSMPRPLKLASEGFMHRISSCKVSSFFYERHLLVTVHVRLVLQVVVAQ